jgi:hypothetical protein
LPGAVGTALGRLERDLGKFCRIATRFSHGKAITGELLVTAAIADSVA